MFVTPYMCEINYDILVHSQTVLCTVCSQIAF